MTNKERLQANNAELQDLIGIAESLPNAGSGGSEYVEEFESFYAGDGSSLTLPNATDLKSRAFSGQYDLEKIIMPKVKNIGPEAFYYCMNLVTIDMPRIETIGAAAFLECSSMRIEKITDSLTQIGRAAFTGCDSITFTELPSGIQKIDALAFQNCLGLTSLTILSPTCPLVGENIFKGCTNLVTINVAWSEDENSPSYPAPWGATNATINYNYTGG